VRDAAPGARDPSPEGAERPLNRHAWHPDPDYSEEGIMPKTYKLIELVGISESSFEEAVANAVASAGETLRGLSWFEVVEQRGRIADGRIAEYQVKVKVAFQVLRES